MLVKKFELDWFMLYVYGFDFCRELDFWYVMVNCFEVLIGVVYLEGSLEEVK